MKTDLADFIRNTDQGQVAESILRKCVHCGFCTATCPTYQLLGNELDGPRGRIYLIKQMVEGAQPTARTQLHLDRCLTCRSCETTCPSGVRYSKLLEIGRDIVEQKVGRSPFQRAVHMGLQFVVPNTFLTSVALMSARLVAFALPEKLKRKIPPKQKVEAWPERNHVRTMIIHQGCIQRVARPGINAAAARYLDRQSISAVRTSDSCCGALGLHLGNRDFLIRHARRNIDAWWPQIKAGAEAIVSTASGCGVTIKEYGELLADDREYAHKAEKISSLTIDISEVETNASPAKLDSQVSNVAFHSPCTLQHGQKVTHSVEQILANHGLTLETVENSHLCCGSAGVYSLLQPEIAEKLLEDKIAALERGNPQIIVTGNIGCLMHLSSRSSVPVKHWVEIVAPASDT
ncbi:MAG: glycolate oxidase subunit GlcF [Acidiferrobacterales bacterium]|nr:glycolate oxidase subunit GlcF [Acidiferrobacterales bacterium]